MLLKSRSESEELMVYRYLNLRKPDLSENEKFHYLNLQKGYEGELIFDQMATCLQEERYIINDLLLKVNGSYFQIDTLMISHGVINILEIKNFYGNFYLEEDKLYSLTTGKEYINPVIQLKRCATLFRQLLQNHKLNYHVDSSIIFINPEFTLYQAPMNQPIIFPSQIKQFFRDLNKTASKLNDGHKNLAQTLISLHQTKNPFIEYPEYSYEQLQKGSYCKTCKSLLVYIKNQTLVCEKCGEHEKVEAAILRNVKEFMLLFPEKKVTTQIIDEWCRLDIHKRTICRTLKKHFTSYGNTRDTYYI
jgi:DNA-directed RNA polymerase subunit M/transcription elongation factor TFIIS